MNLEPRNSRRSQHRSPTQAKTGLEWASHPPTPFPNQSRGAAAEYSPDVSRG